jgi:hypothetical protein
MDSVHPGVEYTKFPNAFFAILQVSLALIFIYFGYK